MKKNAPWACQECGKRMTLKQAEKASFNGCSKCGGVDIELEPLSALDLRAEPVPTWWTEIR